MQEGSVIRTGLLWEACMAEQGMRGNIGENVKTLRKVHRESRDQLAEALYTDYSGVWRIEDGMSRVSEETLELISAYYMVSKEELVNEDIPFIEVQSVDPEAVFRRVDVFFPYVESDDAKKNRSFARALEGQKQLYKGCKEGRCPDVSKVRTMMTFYDMAFEDSGSSLPAAVNRTGLFLLHTLVTEYCAHIIESRPCTFLKKHINKETGRVPESEEAVMSSVVGVLSSEHEKMPFESEVKRLFSYIGLMMDSDEYSQIGDFYLAAARIFNVIRYGKSRERNLQAGLEWMHSLSLTGNPYAIRFCFLK